MSNNSNATGLPCKPYPTFELYPHKKTWRWCKKIKGVTRYFGSCRNWPTDWEDALARYRYEAPYWEAGRTPPPQATETDAKKITVIELVKRFMDATEIEVPTNLSYRTWKQYGRYTDLLVEVLGHEDLGHGRKGAERTVESLTGDDFTKLRAAIKKTHHTLVSETGAIRRIKVVFNWGGPGAEGQRLFPQHPPYGRGFKAPGRKRIRAERKERARIWPRALTADQFHTLLDLAEARATAMQNPLRSRKKGMTAVLRLRAETGVRLKAMLLLGLNCGFATVDCERIAEGDLDLDSGWVTFYREKCGTDRRSPLWQETIDALQRVLDCRRTASKPANAKQVFLSKYGNTFKATAVNHEYKKLAEAAGIPLSSFGDLRRTCDSVGLQMTDTDALKLIMGHEKDDSDMSEHYNCFEIADGRLLAITNHIHQWLFNPAPPVPVSRPVSASGLRSRAPAQPLDDLPVARLVAPSATP